MKQEEVWALQLVYMFLDKYEYRLINVGPDTNKSELWMANPKGKYPVVRVSTLQTSANYFDNDRLVQTKQAIMSLVNTSGKMLSIHVSQEPTEQTEKEIVEVCISENYLSDESIVESYPQITEIIKPLEDPQVEFEKITKAINLVQVKGYRKSKSWVMGDLKTLYVIMGICIGVFIISNMITDITGSKVVTAVTIGALYKTIVYGNYEIWRLLTAGFVHVDLLHLMVNMYSFYHLGPTIERLYGKKNFVIALLGSIVVGSAFALVGSFNTVTVGISGGLFGLLGMLFVYAFESSSIRDKRVLSSFIQIFIINTLVIAFIPNISWLGHAGGFLAGVMFGLIFSKKPSWESLRKNSVIALIILSISLGYMGLIDQRKKPIDPVLDSKVIETYRRFNIDWYADLLEENIIKYYETVR